jgi:hypothetical protein
MNNFGDEPELISSVRQRSFSFSSATDPTQQKKNVQLIPLRTTCW